MHTCGFLTVRLVSADLGHGFHERGDFPDKVVWHHEVGVAGLGNKRCEDGVKELDWRGDSVLSVGVSAV